MVGSPRTGKRGYLIWTVALAAVLLVLFAPDARAGDCLQCHGAVSHKGAPVLESMAGSAHGELGCSECHPGDMPPCPPQGKPASCSACHQDQVKSVGKSSHGKKLVEYVTEEKGEAGLADICLACHGDDIHHLKKSEDEKANTFRGNVVSTCLSCHDHADPYMLEDFKLSVHSTAKKDDGQPAAVCTDCHSAHSINLSTLPSSSLNRLSVHESCGKCHQEQLAEYMESIHSEMLLDGDSDVPTCADCHGTHNIYAKDDVRSLINHLRLDSTCIKCHASQEITERHDRLPPPEFVKSYEKSVHGRGVHTKGLMVSASCIDCHGQHAIRPKDDENSTVYRENVPDTCKRCHMGIFEKFVESEHGILWEKKDPKGPVCTTCHTSHQIQEPTRLLFTTFRITRECGGCHEEKSKTYNDTFHGKTTSMGFLVAAKCSDCHTPHHNLPADDPRSSINPAHLIETCGHCHGEVNANFVKYDPHPDPDSPDKSAMLYWINIFMKLLIAGVFGFFGIHTLLWLQRSFVAVMRGEEEAKFPLEGVKHVRRWSRTAVVMHIVIVSSFLGLVATGLPLRYHYAEWAQVLGSIYGGVEVARYVHRFCAMVTIGYAVYHIIHLGYKILVNHEYHLFYGPDTMVPRWKDVVDLYQNFRYFLYLGPPPQFGKWTYYEKFDYFALFWGVPIVVISGLVMLFPNFFSLFIPGSWLNIASLVHSEEALLAAGFIFIFHFFHNHLRPGVIPMDINIFTGTMPLERLIKERPSEYERLKSEGLLEQLVIDAPESRVMLESRLFGLVALSFGLFLIIAIFVSYMLG